MGQLNNFRPQQYATKHKPCAYLPGAWASCQIRKIAVCACARNARNVFLAGYRSRHASRHVRHARAVMHAGTDNSRFPLKWTPGKTFPAFPAHAKPAILRICQEAHYTSTCPLDYPLHPIYALSIIVYAPSSCMYDTLEVFLFLYTCICSSPFSD